MLTPTSTAAPTPTPTPAPTRESIPTATPTPTPTPTPHPGAVLPELVKVADPPGGDIVELSFAPSNPDVVYLLSQNPPMGAWRSGDAGETWRQVLSDMKDGTGHTTSMAVHPADPAVVLVGDKNFGIIKTVNGGLQWKRVHPAPAWVLSAKGELPPRTEMEVPALAFSPSMPSIAYAADKQGNILKSTDGGDTWQVISQIESEPSSLAVDSRSPDMVYAGAGGGVFKSTDGGWKWQKVSPDGVLDISIASEAPDLLFAASPWAGVFKSSDGGTTWRSVLDLHAHSVQVAPSDPHLVYAGTLSGVFKSDDGGETWLPSSNGMEYLSVGRLTVHPMDPNTVLAGSHMPLSESHGDPFPASTKGEGIYKTTDGGLSWAKTVIGFVDTDPVAVAVSPNNPNLVYVGTRCSRGLYRSEDGGASWTVLANGPRYAAHYTMRIAIAADSVLWLTGGYGMAWTIDGGQTWQSPLTEEKRQWRHFHGIGISPHDPQVIFVGTAGYGPFEPTVYLGARILRSTDGGRSWQEVGSGFPSGTDTGIHDIAFDPFNPEVVYVATTSHGLTEEYSTTVGIYKSADGGETWMPVNTGLGSLDVHAIVPSPARAGLLYAGGHDGVYRSTDGGRLWAPISFGERVWSLVIDPAEPRSLYAGTDHGLFWSFDGGDTWQRLESVPARRVTGLAMDASGKVLYAAVNRVGIFKGVKR